MCVSRIWDHMQPEDHTAHDVARHCRRHGRREEALAAAGDEVELAHVLRREGGRRERLSSVFICASVCARACVRERARVSVWSLWLLAVCRCVSRARARASSSLRCTCVGKLPSRHWAWSARLRGMSRRRQGHVAEAAAAHWVARRRAPSSCSGRERCAAIHSACGLQEGRGGGGLAPDPEPKGDGG